MTEKKQEILAKIISVIFHPLLMPTYALLIIFNSGTHFSYMPFEIKKLVFILVLLSTLVIPVAIIPFLINLKVVSDFTMEKGRERFFPFLVTAMAYYFAYQLLKNISLTMTGFIEIMLLASAILVFFCLLVTLKWKISAHLTGIGGMMGAMIYFSLSYYVNSSLLIIALSLIAGAVAYARLQLNAHTPAQVYVGFISGFGGMAGILYFGL
jgi:hypothetical protein